MKSLVKTRVSPGTSANAMQIEAAGICCPVGYSLAAASCAIRAGMDHFQHSSFFDRSGRPLIAANVPLPSIWGPARLVQLVKFAVLDCANRAGGIDPAHTVLLILAAERSRPNMDTQRYNALFSACETELEGSFSSGSAVFPLGRAGIGDALQHAASLLANDPTRRILLVGADSYLDAATIEHLLAEDRLISTTNANGFIPAEGAAALLLSSGDDSQAGLRIRGVGSADELAKPTGIEPNRAVGLTKAIRLACEAAAIRPNQLEFRMSDQNGEQFYAKEGANAVARVMLKDGVGLPLFHLADSVGETGAAVGPMSLAYLSNVMQFAHGPGAMGLLHFANDDGKRTAIVVEHRTA